jgi:hypothetical protein
MPYVLQFTPSVGFQLPTYTWDRDRELCVGCTHRREVGPTRWNCVALDRGARIDSCWQMRNGGPCGIEGKLFKAKA